MTSIATASTAERDSAAGEYLATEIRHQLGANDPDGIIVFISPVNDYGSVLAALDSRFSGVPLIGCSSAGEFTSESSGTGRTSIFAIRNPEMKFSASLATNLSEGRAAAAKQLVDGFNGLSTSDYRYRTAIVLVDALAGLAEDLVDQLTLATGGLYQLVGGGAGDDAAFSKTHVFCGTQVATNAVVALEVLSNKPVGIGARHGWAACSSRLRVTAASDSCVNTMNVSPAVDAFEDHASVTKQSFDRAQPLPFFLHNVMGISTDQGYKLRVPLGVNPEGGVAFAAEIPVGATAQIMSTGPDDAVAAAKTATADAVRQVKESGANPSGALFFDCVATRLRLGEDFRQELSAVGSALGSSAFAGFNSYGQIVRADGQFNGFHNCTAVVCVFPD
jgi:hypothetical protein